MNLRLSNEGNRADSDNLVGYLVNYLNEMLTSLLAQECFYTAEIFEKKIASVNKQHRLARREGKFVIGWGG